MTQQVFDNGMTAHVWAQQEQDSGRSHNGNFYFEGRAIYSYGPHYVAGYVAPGPLYLVNTDDSSITTNGKHKPAVWRAIDYGRGKYSNHAGVPDLGSIARIFDSLTRKDSFGCTKAEAQQALARHMESDVRAWPGQEAATLIYRAAGMTGPKAFAKAKAGQKRVATAEENRRAKAERAALEKEARAAKYLAANYPPAKAARDVRELLQEAAQGSQWQQERKEAEARDESKQYFRAAKAAKVKGWTRIAAACRASYNATRAEIRGYEAAESRWQERAAIRAAIETVRGMAADMAEAGRAKADTAQQRAARSGALARLCGSLCDCLTRIAESPWCSISGGLPLIAEAGRAAQMRDHNTRRAAEAQQEVQAEARAAWLAGGNGPTWGQGRLVCAEGGALLRAENVERDDSGKIVGGILRTSWAATVPLPEAIRAFRFLKMVRESGQPWAANGSRIRVGHFQVESIDARGNFKAACHQIKWAECARLAESLGLASLAADDSALTPSRGAA